MTDQHMRLLMCVVSFCSLMPWGCSSQQRSDHIGTAHREGQPALTFDVYDVVDPSLVRGPNYTLGRKVAVVDDMYLFEIQTDFGTIPALSRNMLDLRLFEMAAIERAKALSQDPHLVQGAIDGLHSTGEGLRLLLTNPMGSLARAPTGFERMIKEKRDALTGRGASLAERNMAMHVGCDPETRNPILRALIKNMVIREKVGGAAAKLIPHTSAFRLTTTLRDELASKPPHVLNKQIERELIAHGIDDYLSKKFARERHFTTMQRLLFMEQFRPLSRVTGCEALLQRAVDVDSEAGALAALETARVMAGLHASRGVARIDYMGQPIAILVDGSHVAYHPGDYLAATRKAHEGIAAYRKRYPSSHCELVVSGRLSPEVRRVVEAAGIHLTESARAK